MMVEKLEGYKRVVEQVDYMKAVEVLEGCMKVGVLEGCMTVGGQAHCMKVGEQVHCMMAEVLEGYRMAQEGYMMAGHLGDRMRVEDQGDYR